VTAVTLGDIDVLKTVHVHGGDITKFFNDTDSNNGLLHYAVKAN